MALSDDELLDFDSSDYANYDENRARKALAEHGDLYRAQLVAARAIEGWRRRTLKYDETNVTETHPKEWTQGWPTRSATSWLICARATFCRALAGTGRGERTPI